MSVLLWRKIRWRRIMFFCVELRLKINFVLQKVHKDKPHTFLYSLHTPICMIYFPDCTWLIIPEGGTWMGSWGWLMLSVWRGPVRCELARMEPVFTQPLRPDWEALFSHPGAFQRKPPAEAPRLRYTTLKTIHTASCSPCRDAYFSCTLIIIIIIQKLSIEYYGKRTAWYFSAS